MFLLRFWCIVLVDSILDIIICQSTFSRALLNHRDVDLNSNIFQVSTVCVFQLCLKWPILMQSAYSSIAVSVFKLMIIWESKANKPRLTCKVSFKVSILYHWSLTSVEDGSGNGIIGRWKGCYGPLILRWSGVIPRIQYRWGRCYTYFKLWGNLG